MLDKAHQERVQTTAHFAHAKRKKDLDDAMRRGNLWNIVKAQFALDVESMFDGFLKQVVDPDLASHHQ